MIYVSDTMSSITNGHLVQYVDDAILGFSSKSKSYLEIKILESLNNCIQYFYELSLTTSLTKSTHISFSTSSKLNITSLPGMIDIVVLEWVLQNS